MTNEGKAKEIYKDNLYDCEVKGVAQDKQEILFMLEKMATWKEQQMIEKACEFIKGRLEDTEVLDDYRRIMVRGVQASYTTVDELIEGFKKHLKGE